MRRHFEAYATGTPAPTVTQEVDMAVAARMKAVRIFKKTQVIEYQAMAASIKPFEERKDSKGRTRSTCLIGKFLSDARYAFTLKHMPVVHQLRL